MLSRNNKTVRRLDFDGGWKDQRPQCGKEGGGGRNTCKILMKGRSSLRLALHYTRDGNPFSQGYQQFIFNESSPDARSPDPLNESSLGKRPPDIFDVLAPFSGSKTPTSLSKVESRDVSSSFIKSPVSPKKRATEKSVLGSFKNEMGLGRRTPERRPLAQLENGNSQKSPLVESPSVIPESPIFRRKRASKEKNASLLSKSFDDAYNEEERGITCNEKKSGKRRCEGIDDPDSYSSERRKSFKTKEKRRRASCLVNSDVGDTLSGSVDTRQPAQSSQGASKLWTMLETECPLYPADFFDSKRQKNSSERSDESKRSKKRNVSSSQERHSADLFSQSESESLHISNMAIESLHSSNEANESLNSEDMALKSLHSSNGANESLHSDDMAIKSLHSRNGANESLHGDDMAIKSLYCSNGANESLHGDDMAIKSLHSSNGANESLHGDSIAIESLPSLKMATESANASNMGTESGLEGQTFDLVQLFKERNRNIKDKIGRLHEDYKIEAFSNVTPTKEHRKGGNVSPSLIIDSEEPIEVNPEIMSANKSALPVSAEVTIAAPLPLLSSGVNKVNQLSPVERRCARLAAKYSKRTSHLITRETQLIEEFSTETLHLQPPTTKNEGWSLEPKMSQVICEEPAVCTAPSSVTPEKQPPRNIEQLLQTVMKSKTAKRGSLLWEVQTWKKSLASERRVREYEGQKDGAHPPPLDQGCSFVVHQVWGRAPLRVYGLLDGRAVLLLLDEELVTSGGAVVPGCRLTFYPPWEVDEGCATTTYYPAGPCHVIDDNSNNNNVTKDYSNNNKRPGGPCDVRQDKNRHSVVEIPAGPFRENHHLFVEALLGNNWTDHTRGPQVDVSALFPNE